MSARTTLPVDLNVELPMPALVRTYSASSTDSDSSPPTTPGPTSADYLGRPFDEIDTKKQVITLKKSFSSPRRRTVATSDSVQKQKEQDALQLSAMQVVFLIGMLFVDVLRIMSWIPICLRIIFKELWIVIECEGVDPATVKRGLGVVLALVVCYYLFL
ncbi:hypothetical protein EXIGLDRAFT_771842 [Exidia glandulosa HHB12029]|uniref:Uncharacterized protein n=1 Tax=Exidia glandulosa HHB12029 TaxID=1314781 RepID=A0A166A7R0_EXIGL|nr:hypothetical protein EXIGLDRAFT_771842 [Exidia glandulosa HHB12029]